MAKRSIEADIEYHRLNGHGFAMKRTLYLSVTLMALAGNAQAACYADYKAKRDDPLRLHYGVAEITGDCYLRREKRVQENTTSAIEARQTGNRIVVGGIAAIVIILATAAVLLFMNLPDANAFNARVEQLFVENASLTGQSEIKLLEILAQSGTAFSETLDSYRFVIFVLLVFATALLIAAVAFLVMLIGMNRRMGQIERKGIEVNSLLISRDQKMVYLNNFEFKLTDAAIETLSVLAEARMDDEVLSGAEIEAVISGRSATDCEEAAGATRIKRLRDTLGNQMISELLVRNIARRGYMLAIDKDVIRMV